MNPACCNVAARGCCACCLQAVTAEFAKNAEDCGVLNGGRLMIAAAIAPVANLSKTSVRQGRYGD